MLAKEIKARQSVVSESSLRSPSSSIKNPDSVLRYSSTVKDPGLQFRDWLIIVAELFVSLAWLCIRQRRRIPEELRKRGMKEREESIDFLFWEGWVVFGSLIVGYFIDSHVSYYIVALFNVLFHFVMTSFIFMEEIIMIYDKDNPYSDIMSVLATVSIFVVKSTDFTRYDKLVLGLQNLKTKDQKKITLYLFIFTWVGGRIADGGIVWKFLQVFQLHDLTVTGVALVVNGISIYFYAFLLKPLSTKSRAVEGNRVMGCMLSAIMRKLRYRKSRSKSRFFSFANRRYDKRTVLATKELIRLFKNLFPTIGYVLYVTFLSEDYIEDILTRLKATGIFYYVGLTQGIVASILLSMLITQFAIFPLLAVMGAPDKFHVRFLIGYGAAIFSMFYTAVALTSWSTDSKFSVSVGEVRIFNVRNADVNFSSREPDFTKLNFTVRTGESSSLQFPSKEARLFKVAIAFDPEMSWTMHMSVDPLISTGYILTENPPYVMRIGEIPVEEGPPGTNSHDRSRLYLFNSVSHSKFRFSIKKTRTEEEMIQIRSQVGVLHVMQLPEGEYDLVLLNMARLAVNVSIGGVYGILLYSDGLKRKIIFDETVPSNSLPSSLCIGFVVPAGVSLTFAYISLRAITFTSAPEGLLGIAFGFLTALEYLTAWILCIGYMTWHPYAKAESLFTYGFGQTVFLFVTMFVFMKYKDSYGW